MVVSADGFLQHFQLPCRGEDVLLLRTLQYAVDIQLVGLHPHGQRHLLLRGSIQCRCAQKFLDIIVVLALVQHHALDTLPQQVRDVAHRGVGVLLEGVVVGFQRHGVAHHPQEVFPHAEVVLVVVGRGHNLDVLLKAVLLCRMEGHAHRSRGEAVQVVALGMASLGEYDDGIAVVDALCHLVERLEVLLQSLAAFPSETVGRHQPYPAQKPHRPGMYLEDVGACQGTDMIAYGEGEHDVQRVVGCVLVVAHDEVSLAGLRHLLYPQRISPPHQQRLVDESQVAFQGDIPPVSGTYFLHLFAILAAKLQKIRKSEERKEKNLLPLCNYWKVFRTFAHIIIRIQRKR